VLTTGDDLTPGQVVTMVNTSRSGEVAGRGNTIAPAAG
jgi:hypothetical protein